MSNFLDQIASNKMIRNLAFKKIQDAMKENNITLIAITLDSNGEIALRQFTKPVAVVDQSELNNLIKTLNDGK